MHCVYVLFSTTIHRHYCGQTNNLPVRLEQHNAGLTVSNKHGIPWQFVGFINCEIRSEANIKRASPAWFSKDSYSSIRRKLVGEVFVLWWIRQHSEFCKQKNLQFR